MTQSTTEATFHADDPLSLWRVVEGEVDLFLVVEDGRWHPLMTCAAPAVVPGLPQGELQMIGRGTPGSRVEQLPLTALDDLDPAEVDAWLEPVMERVSRATFRRASSGRSSPARSSSRRKATCCVPSAVHSG